MSKNSRTIARTHLHPVCLYITPRYEKPLRRMRFRRLLSFANAIAKFA
jgi:hypothetical protein